MTRRILGLAIAVLVVVLLWIGYWAVASHLVRQTVEHEVADAGAHGAVIACDTLTWGGFPFRFERDCTGVRITAEGNRISAGRVLAVLQAWDYSHAVALIDGPVVLDLPAVPLQATLTHGRALASVRRLGDAGWRASIDVPQFKADRFGSADHLLVSARMTDTALADIALNAERLTLSNLAIPPLALDAVSFDASLPSAALNRDMAHVLAQSGETITIRALDLRKGDLALSASGTIGVDAAGYPSGTLLTSCNRLDLLMQTLRTDFGMKDEDVQSLSAMIGILNGGKADGPAKLNLIAKDGKLYWGPVRLADLPALF
ncbi:DUF2125 domain-containing protein [soil metagenome]